MCNKSANAAGLMYLKCGTNGAETPRYVYANEWS
jgi:hypothetical protein